MKLSYDNQCIAGKGENKEISLETCDAKDKNQKWIWSAKNDEAIERLKSGKSFAKVLK